MQKPLLLTLGSVGLMLSMSACAPNLARRYRNFFEPSYTWVGYKHSTAYAEVDLASFTLEKPAPVAPTLEKPVRRSISSLAPRAQEALIKVLADKYKTAASLLQSLGDPFPVAKEAAEPPPVNRIRIIPKQITKRLVVAANKISYAKGSNDKYRVFNGDADRLTSIEYEIILVDSTKTTFNTWDSFESKFGVINLGKVSSSQGVELTANISAKAGGSVNLSNAASNELSTTDSNGITRETSSGSTSTSGNSAQSTLGSTNTSGTSGNGASSGTESTSGSGTTATNGTERTIGRSNSSSSKNDVVGKNTGNTSKGTTSTFEVGPTVGGTYSSQYATGQDLTDKVLFFSATLHEGRMRIKQKGAQGNDVGGNNQLIVECETKADWATPIVVTKFSKLYDSGRNPAAFGTYGLEKVLVLFPDVAREDVKGYLRFKYIHRTVDQGSRHLPEARQKIEFHYGEFGYKQDPSDVREVTLLRAKDFRPSTYRLSLDVGGTMADVSIGGTTLNFDTPAEALTFLEYLHTALNPAAMPATLKLGAVALTPANLVALKVRTHDN